MDTRNEPSHSPFYKGEWRENSSLENRREKIKNAGEIKNATLILTVDYDPWTSMTFRLLSVILPFLGILLEGLICDASKVSFTRKVKFSVT